MPDPSGPFLVASFGVLTVTRPDGAPAPLQAQSARALLALLLLHRGRPVHREAVCAALWPEAGDAAARAQLRKALWRLRGAFDPTGATTGPLRATEHQVGLDPDRLEVDLWRFLDTMRDLDLTPDAELTAADALALHAAVDLNRDTFAAGLFDEWCTVEQESLRNARLLAMERLVGYHLARASLGQAIDWAQRALALDPLREHLHLAIMDARTAMGDRALAIRQYRSCEEVIRREIGLAPSPEMRSLFRRLTAVDEPAVPAAS